MFLLDLKARLIFVFLLHHQSNFVLYFFQGQDAVICDSQEFVLELLKRDISISELFEIEWVDARDNETYLLLQIVIPVIVSD